MQVASHFDTSNIIARPLETPLKKPGLKDGLHTILGTTTEAGTAEHTGHGPAAIRPPDVPSQNTRASETQIARFSFIILFFPRKGKSRLLLSPPTAKSISDYCSENRWECI